MINKTPFLQYSNNITSQFGEDGIIKEIFNRIGTKYKICVELGAWDGKHFSNTWNLWFNNEWHAILIEADKNKFLELIESAKDIKRVQTINKLVTINGQDSLNNILLQLNIPFDFELLSIDIGGDDYFLFENLTNFKPKVIIIEYNPTIPVHLSIVQKPGEYFGASVKAVYELAKNKEYQLVYITDTNIILVQNAYFPELGINIQELADIFPNKYINCIFSSFDGKLFISNKLIYPIISPSQKFFLSNSNNFQIDIDQNELPFCSDKEIHRIFIKRKKYKIPKIVQKIVKNNFIKRVSINSNIDPLKDWIKIGKPLPPPVQYKHNLIKKYRKNFNINILVETGTYLGDTITYSKNIFSEIYSIELDAKLADQAIEKFKKNFHIHIMQGDSSIVLKNILLDIHKPALFWLDGHYSEGITAKGTLNTPILQELNHIKNHNIKNHVILIDDARYFNGKDDYPTLQEINEIAKIDFPKHSIEVIDDIIRLIPNKF